MFPDLTAGLEPSATKPPNEILVVDDDPDLVRGLARILKARGYLVYEATCGHHAVELAKAHRLKIAVMDIMMPGLNGIEAFRQMKLSSPHAAVIFLTGFSEFEQEAHDEGAVAVLRKPIDYQHLFETLETLKEL